jgi:hypothetical protein
MVGIYKIIAFSLILVVHKNRYFYTPNNRDSNFIRYTRKIAMCAYPRYIVTALVQCEFFCAKKIKLGVKMVEFLEGVSLSGFPHSQSMFYTLVVYSSTKGLAVVSVFILFQNFPSCFWVNDGVEHVAAA